MFATLRGAILARFKRRFTFKFGTFTSFTDFNEALLHFKGILIKDDDRTSECLFIIRSIFIANEKSSLFKPDLNKTVKFFRVRENLILAHGKVGQ